VKITLDIESEMLFEMVSAFRWELFNMEDTSAANPDDLECEKRMLAMDCLYWELRRAVQAAGGIEFSPRQHRIECKNTLNP